MNKYIVEFCNNDSIVIESKYDHADKAFNELIVKRYYEHEGVLYNCLQVVKIVKVTND